MVEKNYQPQLVKPPDFSHQQDDHDNFQYSLGTFGEGTGISVAGGQSASFFSLNHFLHVVKHLEKNYFTQGIAFILTCKKLMKLKVKFKQGVLPNPLIAVIFKRIGQVEPIKTHICFLQTYHLFVQFSSGVEAAESLH